ncbi:MAG: fumarylacetoacetate hydrolase family protein [Ignavibacteriaceae bacterium]
MSFNIVRFKSDNTIQWGFVKEENVILIDGMNNKSLPEFIKDNGIESAKELSKKSFSKNKLLKLDSAEILSPVTYPCSIICQGKNYSSHIKEIGGTQPVKRFTNILFTKAASSLTNPNGPVYKPKNVQLLDYELELGFIIGKRINKTERITKENLNEFIAGIVMSNDVSARDIQIPEEQWFHGKSFRSFCPTGPYLCVLESEEIEKLGELKLELFVNQQKRQSAFVNEMNIPIYDTLTLLSSFMDLEVGDLILTGTPSGVGLQIKNNFVTKLAGLFFSEQKLNEKFIEIQLKSNRYLKNGDIVTSTISTKDETISLGKQEFKILDAND